MPWSGLELVDVCKGFSGRGHALASVSLKIMRGECAVVMGENGCGKSTLLRLAVGLVRPDSGEVMSHFTGGRVVPYITPSCGVVMEGATRLYERLSLTENCRYLTASRGKRWDSGYFGFLCDRLQLSAADIPFRKLSTGNKQRGYVIASLCHRPDLVVLDEPTLGLDEVGVALLSSLIRWAVTETRCAVLVASHDTEFVDSIGSRFYQLSRGGLVLRGSCSDSVRSKWKVRVNGASDGELLGSEHTAISPLIAHIGRSAAGIDARCVSIVRVESA